MVLVATQVKRRRGTTAENDAFTGAEGEITVDTEKHELRVHDGMTQGGFKIGGGSGSGRNIGDIFMTKRTDSGLSGAVECNGGTYNTTDYDGDGSIGELLEAGKLDYISLTDYATAINTKGWCDKIGWNGAGTTSFRVPTLTPRIIQTNNIPVVGNGGVLNVGGNGQAFPLYTSGSKTVQTDYYAATLRNLQLNTDPTKSGIIADTSDTAQLRVMIQIADGATDEALETCTQVLADVAALKYDYVVDFQAPTAQNNYTWYRKYKSGWVEQGGVSVYTSDADYTVSLPIEMTDTNYTVLTTVAPLSSPYTGQVGVNRLSAFNLTTTSFKLHGDTAATMQRHCWQVSGKSAQ